MKKLIYCALALAAGLFAASCQQENLEAVKGGSTVTFTVEVPEAVATKAAVVENGENINNLVYAVYRTTESSEDAFKKLNPELFVYGVNPVAEGKTTVFADNKTTISLELINNQKYVVLFWAQVDQTWVEGEINENSLTSISYPDPEDLVANDSKYAAFSGVAFVEEVEKVNGPRSVTLTRPFAQINLATNNPERYDVDVIKSSVKIENAAATFNVATQQASGTRTVEYALATNPDGTFNGYDHYVAMNYIFANPKGENSETVSVTCVMDTKEHGEGIEKVITNVPVAQNYKTNIVGNLLTSDVEYTVELNDNWEDGYIVSPGGDVTKNTFVESASEIQDIIETLNEDADVTSAMITLNEDIDLNVTTRSETSASPSFTIKSGNTLTIDLNGHTITGVDKTEANFGLITNQGNLTIVNSAAGKIGKISLEAEHNNGWNRYSSVISTQPGSTLTVGAGVEIEHLGGTDMSYGIDILTNGKGTSAVAVIDGATVKSNYRAIRQFLNGTEANNSLTVKSGSVIKSESGNKSIWMQDPSKNANTGTLVVEEGANLMNDVYLSVTEGSTKWPVSVSIAASALKDGSTVASSNVPAGYKVEQVDGFYTVNFYPVAKIGETEYATLNEAVAAVEDGQIIALVSDIEQVDGVIITDKNITIDLNDKTFTVSEGASTNNRNFKINGSSNVTIKNGTLIAEGELTSGAYGTVRTEDTAKVTLEDVNLYSYRGFGLNVKALSGTTINITNSEIYAQYSGGVEAAGGTINLTNVKIEQTGVYSDASWCSVAIGVNSGGKVVVNSGEYSAATISTDSNAAQGTWVAYVMNSGGTLNINGGTFNGTIAETSAASNACGLICADAKAIVNIYEGTFNSNGAILDMRNNTGATPNPVATLYGGNFSADPRISGLYSSNLISVAENYKVVVNNGVWTVVVDPVAKIGETEYDTLQEAFNVGGNVTLLRNATITEPAKLDGGKTAVLDLNGKTLTAELASALVSTGGSNLTVKNGSVIAYESTVRAIGGTLVVESGEYTSTGTALDSPATNRYSLDCREGGELIIKGGTFKSNNGMINVGSTVTINGGKFENIVEKATTRHFAYVSAPLTINDGEFYGKANASAGGCLFCGAAAAGEIQINGGKFTSLWTSGSANAIFEVYFGGTINVTGGMFNTNKGITNFVVANTDEATKDAYPYVAK